MNHTCELIRQAKDGDKEARNQLARENSGLVWSIVRRFQGRGYEPEDLFQTGNIGLIKSIDNFDFDRNVKFSTYAVPMIMGEIRRFLRDDGMIKVSRSLKEISYKIYKEKEIYQREYQREPTIREIAASLELDEEDVILALESGQEVRSLQQVIYQGEGDDICLQDRLESRSDEILKAEKKVYLKQLLDALSCEEYALIDLRFFQNRTQVAAAEKLGVSQVQVSRMEKKILKKLRNMDEDYKG